jgi:hypothetical protein
MCAVAALFSVRQGSSLPVHDLSQWHCDGDEASVPFGVR